MNSNLHPFYSHSGKFGFHGPVLALLVGAAAAYPLGIAYAFQQGDIAPLEQARPRVPASGKFARLTLKHSARCDDYCALSIANVTVTLDKDGKPDEEVEEIMSNLWVPKTMFDYLAQFDRPTARVTPNY
jgi:hypothetical protein